MRESARTPSRRPRPGCLPDGRARRAGIRGERRRRRIRPRSRRPRRRPGRTRLRAERDRACAVRGRPGRSSGIGLGGECQDLAASGGSQAPVDRARELRRHRLVGLRRGHRGILVRTQVVRHVRAVEQPALEEILRELGRVLDAGGARGPDQLPRDAREEVGAGGGGSRRSHEQLRHRARGGRERLGSVRILRLPKDRDEDLPTGSAHHAGERVGLGGEVAGGRVVRQALGVDVPEVVHGVPQRSRERGILAVLVPDRGAELLGQPRDQVRARRIAAGLRVDVAGQPGRRQGDRDGREVAEGLVERGDLEVRRVPEVRPHGVQDRVPLFVRGDVGALTGLDARPGLRVHVAKETQRLAIVEGVQVRAGVGHRREDRPRNPWTGSGQALGPETLAAVERGAQLPVQELRRVRRVRSRGGSRPLDAKGPRPLLGRRRRRGRDQALAAAGGVVQEHAEARSLRLVHRNVGTSTASSLARRAVSDARCATIFVMRQTFLAALLLLSFGAVAAQDRKTSWPLSLADGLPKELPGYAAAPTDPLPNTDENEMGVFTEVSRFFQRIESPTVTRQFRLVVQDYGKEKNLEADLRKALADAATAPGVETKEIKIAGLTAFAATDRSGPNPTTLISVVVLPFRLVLAQGANVERDPAVKLLSSVDFARVAATK